MAEGDWGYEENVKLDKRTFLPKTKTYHGIVIKANGTTPVGRISEYTPKFMARTLTPVYELSASTFGRPIDYVPSKEEGREITCSRVEVWNEEYEIAFGATSSEWRDLCDQYQPFSIHESWQYGGTSPSGAGQDYRTWIYSGVWIASKDLDAFSSEGDAIVKASVTMNYVVRHQQ